MVPLVGWFLCSHFDGVCSSGLAFIVSKRSLLFLCIHFAKVAGFGSTSVVRILTVFYFLFFLSGTFMLGLVVVLGGQQRIPVVSYRFSDGLFVSILVSLWPASWLLCVAHFR